VVRQPRHRPVHHHLGGVRARPRRDDYLVAAVVVVFLTGVIAVFAALALTRLIEVRFPQALSTGRMPTLRRIGSTPMSSPS
jgi:hypothetical protein